MSVITLLSSLKSFEPIKHTASNGIVWENPKLYPQLQASHEDALNKIAQLKTDNDVANLLEVPVGQLLHILYKRKQNYQSFKVKKKTGGYRVIDSPSDSVKILQYKIKPLLESLYRVKKPVHGFVGDGKGIISNAEQHKKQKYVLNIDLADFFHSIHFGRVRGIFMNIPFNMSPDAATVMAQLCTHNQRLPQGAPTSPVLSNLAATTLDKNLLQLAKRFHLTYTRYADDITFSGNKHFPSALVEKVVSDSGVISYEAGSLLKSKVEESGFNINHKKTRLQHRSERQEVTGLVVNAGVNVNRKFIRETRAIIHNWGVDLIDAEKKYLEKYFNATDFDKAKLDGSILKKAVYGRLGFIKMVRGEDHSPYLTLCKKVLELDSSPPQNIHRLKKVFEMYDIFICHASEEKQEVAIPLCEELEKHNVRAFVDCFEISWGDSLVAKINTALQKSKFVVAIISENSVKKAWPMKELNAVLSLEIGGEEKKLLPLIVGDDEELIKQLPLLGDKLYKKFENNVSEIAEDLRKLVHHS